MGDLVKVLEEEEFPADLLAISCSNPNGTCYIETANLDGYDSHFFYMIFRESGLKTRYCVPNTVTCVNEHQLEALSGYIDAPPPNIHIDSFDATLGLDLESLPADTGLHMNKCQVKRASRDRRTVLQTTSAELSINATNLLLRVKNSINFSVFKGITFTKYRVGMWSGGFHGKDTKVIMNQQKAPSKFTHVERLLNKYVIVLMLIVLLLCFGSAMGGQFWQVISFFRGL